MRQQNQKMGASAMAAAREDVEEDNDNGAGCSPARPMMKKTRRVMRMISIS